MPAKISLEVIEGSLIGKSYVFNERICTIIGRATYCYPRLEDSQCYQAISRHHCLLDINPPYIRIRDLGSLNGTYVNGRKIGQRSTVEQLEKTRDRINIDFDLNDGDQIKIGQIVLQVNIWMSSRCTRCKTEIQFRKKEILNQEGGLILCASCQEKTSDIKTKKTVAPIIKITLCVVCNRDISRNFMRQPIDEILCARCQKHPFGILRALNFGVKSGVKELSFLRGINLVKILGKGTYGQVFLAQRCRDNEYFALKILVPQTPTNYWAKSSFLREIENTKALKHSKVVKLYNSGNYFDIFFYTMEFCDGGTIEQARMRFNGKLPLKIALPIILHVLEGLEYIHKAEIPKVKLADGSFGKGRGLVHRDLKPSNIFLARNGTNYNAKIADVGIGKAFDLAGLSGHTKTGSVSGTPVFMSRQQVINFKYAKPDVDVWATAATLYFLLTGEYPRHFDADKDPWRVVLESKPVPIRHRNSTIPKPLANIIDIALIDNPEITYRSSSELKLALKKVIYKNNLLKA